jgi:hypothetical protein
LGLQPRLLLSASDHLSGLKTFGEMLCLGLFLFSLLWLPATVLAAFGYTDDGSNYVIDSGAALVIKVSKTNGDITSLKYNGVEYNGYDGKNTEVESGLGTSTVTIEVSANTEPQLPSALHKRGRWKKKCVADKATPVGVFVARLHHQSYRRIRHLEALPVCSLWEQ